MANTKRRAKVKRRRMGRPPQAPERVRRNRVTTFVTDDEFAKLETIAAELDTSLPSALYKLVARALKRRK